MKLKKKKKTSGHCGSWGGGCYVLTFTLFTFFMQVLVIGPPKKVCARYHNYALLFSSCRKMNDTFGPILSFHIQVAACFLRHPQLWTLHTQCDNSICAAAKPAWTSLELKLKCEYLSLPSFLSPTLPYNIILSALSSSLPIPFHLFVSD